jgi:unsaturated pyranuronate lyase
MAYFDQAGDASDAPGRWASFDALPALNLVPGLTFQPLTTDSVMVNRVILEPDAVTDMHHHVEQQIAIVIAGELTLTVGGETRVAHAGDCVVIPPHVPHGGHAGPEGCTAIDVFTPPRAGIVQAMAQ